MRTSLRLKKQQRRKLPTEFQHPANLIHGDTRELSSYQRPPIDLSITSPPYMAAHDTADPFTNHTQDAERTLRNTV
jgi:hypothetical protein